MFSKRIGKIKAGRKKEEGEEENKGKELEEGEQDDWEKWLDSMILRVFSSLNDSIIS